MTARKQGRPSRKEIYRVVRRYDGVPVGEDRALKETWISPWHGEEYGALGHPVKVLLCKMIQDRADELGAAQPREDPDALYTLAEDEVFTWFDRTRPSLKRLERHVLGPARAKRGRPAMIRPRAADDDLRAAFLALPAAVKRSKLSAAMRLHVQFPAISVRTLRRRLAELGQ